MSDQETAASVVPSGATPDTVVPFQVDALDARGRAVLLGPQLDRILSRHDYPEPVARLLGEMVALTVLMGTSLKFEGKFIIQAHGDGPVSLLVVDFVTPGSLRAYASFSADAVAAAIKAGKTDPEQLLGKGTLALTLDQGRYMQRYQGIVQLDGVSLEEVARNYFRQSEQIPTDIRLAAGQVITPAANGEGTVTSWRAGGLLAQFLPAASERMHMGDLDPGEKPEGARVADVEEDDAWAEIKALVSTIGDDELLDEEIGPERLLFRLFHERGVRVYEGQPVVESCGCSREKVLSVLQSMGEDDQREAADDNGRIAVTCEFCSQNYVFDLPLKD